MIKIIGKEGTSVTVVADSISPSGERFITFEWEYSRMIHAEIMTVHKYMIV